MSKGWVSLVWLAHMMTGDHRKVDVQRMLNGCRESLSGLLGVEVRESEFNDDRLGRILETVGQAGRAEEIELAMNEQCLRYYRLKTERPLMRIDTTSVTECSKLNKRSNFGFETDMITPRIMGITGIIQAATICSTLSSICNFWRGNSV